LRHRYKRRGWMRTNNCTSVIIPTLKCTSRILPASHCDLYPPQKKPGSVIESDAYDARKISRAVKN
jgi:hypothetical protein